MEKKVNAAHKNSESFFEVIRSLGSYRFLIKQLVSRDFRLKYKRSILGVLWSFLNPLLTMSVQYIVFSALFRFEIEHYPVYLLTGIVMFGFFSEASSLTMNSLINSAALIKKVYVPKYIYPLTRTMSSVINLIISMIPLLIVALISGIRPSLSFFMIVVPILCISIFTLGVGLLLASSMTIFRDTQYLWGVVSMIWMYLTPIFYPASILPEKVAWIIKVNPLYYFIDFMRTCLIDGSSPDAYSYAMCFICAFAALLLGAFVFNKEQDRFILYL